VSANTEIADLRTRLAALEVAHAAALQRIESIRALMTLW